MSALPAEPRVRPFRALRYVPGRAGTLDRLIAPPYDVIPEAQRQLLAAEPHNIVHLDLPVAGDEQGSNPYTLAGERLRGWIRDGLLARDPQPALYLCEQEFKAPDGTTRRRRGVFARLRLEPLDGGRVIPHERTLDRPRLDRQRLLEATGTYLSAVFLLHPDPGGLVTGRLAALAGGEPLASAREADGTQLRLFALREASEVEPLTQALGRSWTLIADGHHRYESALAYHEARQVPGGAGEGHLLAFLCSLEDPGLAIFPIHRLIHSLSGFEPERVQAALRTCFELEPVASPAALPAAVRSARGRPGVFGLVFGGGRGALLARWREGEGLDRPALRAVPPALRRLDVILLHRLVLEEMLQISPEAQARQDHLEYLKDETQLLERAREAQLGVLLNPTPIDQVVEVSRAGLRLPQKSTYFYPKVPSGLVLDPIDA